MSQAEFVRTSITDARSRRIQLCLVLLGAFLRLYRLDLISITNITATEGLNAVGILRLMDGWDWPLAGALTDDVRSSAFLISLSALAGMCYWHPVALLAPVLVLNILSVWLICRVSSRHFGQFVATVATLMYATSPWAVSYSRQLLPVSCLAFFALLLFNSSARWLADNSRHQLGISVLLACLLPQVHFSGFCALPWIVVVLVRGRRHLSVVPVVAGTAIGVAAWIPWLRFQQLTGWTEIATWAGQLLDAPVSHLNSFVHATRTLAQTLYATGAELWLGNAFTTSMPYWLMSLLSSGAVLVAALLVAGFIQQAVRPGRWAVWLLVLWLMIVALQSALFRNVDSPDGVLVAQPFALILIAVAIDRIRQQLPSSLQYSGYVLVLALSLGNLTCLRACVRIVSAGQQEPNGPYELSLSQRQTVLAAVHEDAGAAPIVIVGNHGGWYPAYEYMNQFAMNGGTTSKTAREGMYCYWIDEEPIDDQFEQHVWWREKERLINPQISAYLGSPPDWSIERSLELDRTVIYRLRLEEKTPLQ